MGFVEDAAVQPFVFDEQYNTFYKYGYAVDPSENNFVGDMDAFHKSGGESVYNIQQSERKRRKIEHKKAKLVKLLWEIDDEEVLSEVENPASEAWLRKNSRSPWAGEREGVGGELTEEQRKHAQEYAKKRGGEREDEDGKISAAMVEKSTFHGKEETDYQGRSWLAPPKDAKASNDHCYMPKRLIYTWSGHT